MCERCNISINYYPKYNDSSNIDTYIQCYHTTEIQIGYYLDNVNKIYKPCYYKCKKCSREGNEDNNYCEECKDNYIFDNGNCRLKTTESNSIINYLTISSNKMEQTENNNIIDLISSYLWLISTHVNNTSIIDIDSTILKDNNEEPKYFYDISSISEEEKHNKTQVYIDVNQEIINFIKEKFDLNDDQKIFITIIEKNNNAPNTATTDYIYEFTLENGTVLDINSIEEDVYVDTYVPIKDSDSAHLDLAIEFKEQGYDIYDIYSDFYTDFCTPASIDGNDVSLDDRIKDIYPHNVTLCKSNC